MRIVHRGILIGVLAIVARPKTSLFVSAIVLAICVGAAAMRLNISTDQNKLFDPKVAFFKDYLRFVELFPENEAIYVVVQARDPKSPPPAVKRWTALADAITEK